MALVHGQPEASAENVRALRLVTQLFQPIRGFPSLCAAHNDELPAAVSQCAKSAGACASPPLGRVRSCTRSSEKLAVMVDVFLLVVAIVAPLFLLALNFYLMVHLSHPDDKNQAYFPKALFVRAPLLAHASLHAAPVGRGAHTSTAAPAQLVGLLLCEGAVLMLPLDVVRAPAPRAKSAAGAHACTRTRTRTQWGRGAGEQVRHCWLRHLEPVLRRPAAGHCVAIRVHGHGAVCGGADPVCRLLL